MSCSFGDKFKISIFGQSHSEAIGVVIDGIPSGIKLDMENISAFLARRSAVNKSYATKRSETDKPEFLSGIVNGVTCGAPLCAIIRNNDCHSSDYEKLKNLPRPSHADFSAYIKHGGLNDIRGGGNFSGRMTAPLCFAGAVAMQILEQQGIFIGAHIEKIAGICDDKFDLVRVNKNQLDSVKNSAFPLINNECEKAMREKIDEARQNLDSVGGVIECAAIGVKAGIGEPIFDGIENMISHIVFGIPAVKGIEFGNGFDCANLTGSENNDEFTVSDGEIKTKTNNHGGILGGISSGMPIVFRVAVKPTPSIGKEQVTVDLNSRKEEKLVIGGRHDPCIVPRAVPCVEAAAAIAIINLM